MHLDNAPMFVIYDFYTPYSKIQTFFKNCIQKLPTNQSIIFARFFIFSYLALSEIKDLLFKNRRLQYGKNLKLSFKAYF